MRAFILLSLIALASADVSHLTGGYNYQFRRSGGSVSGFDGGCSGGAGAGGAGCVRSIGGFVGGSDDGGFGLSSNLSPSISSGSSGGGGFDSGDAAGGSLGFGSGGADGGHDKEFYTYSADDNDFEEPQSTQDIVNLVKPLRVVFIKGPEPKILENAALSLAKHASEPQIAIYVLNKQADIGNLANQMNRQNSQNHYKPEVHFVKYRTSEDAQNAQTQIQNQYASLGGSSQSHNAGVAPALNFASPGSSGNINSAGSGGSYYGSSSNLNPSNAYVLPTNSYVPPAAVSSASYIPPADPSNSYIPPSFVRIGRI